jgi:hypothetical protein
MTVHEIARLRRMRDSARRLVWELATVGLLAVTASTTLPGHDLMTGWDFLAPTVLLVLHALVGALVVVDGIGLVVTASWTSTRRHVYLPAVGLAGALVALGTGLSVLAGVDSGSLWFPMALGWVVAMVAYIAQWRGAARTLEVLGRRAVEVR